MRSRFGMVAGIGLALLAGGFGTWPEAHAGTTTGFAFLNLPAGARAAALGGAYVALADDATALYWNPAGIASASDLDTPPSPGSSGLVTAVHHESILHLRQEFLGAVYRRDGDGLSLALNAHYSESIEERDALGNLTGSFGADDLAVSVGYARSPSSRLRVGGSVAWVREALGGTGASAASLSTGVLYAPRGGTGLTLGAAIRNLGPSASFRAPDGTEGESVPQPLTVAAGAAWSSATASLGWTVTSEVLKLRGDDAEARLGVEVRPATALALRAGWMLGQDAADLTAGAGLATGRWAFDYAFVPYHDDLGSSHRASLGARF
jgi:hypothetical protein